MSHPFLTVSNLILAFVRLYLVVPLIYNIALRFFFFLKIYFYFSCVSECFAFMDVCVHVHACYYQQRLGTEHQIS